MLSFSLGPLVVSLQHLLLFLALGAALLGGWLAARGGGRNAEPVLFNLLLLGLLVARLAFVVRYWPQYRGDFAQMLDIRDGGFLAWPGLLAAVLGALFWAWRRPALRRSLGVGASLGLAFWLLGSLGLGIYERGTRLPELSLRNAAGESVQLADFRGRPLVINLWASWCPPCRREMPVLQQAQAENPDVVFLFANQGESAETVRHFLQGENLRLDNLLFDNGGQLGQQVGSVALPTTVLHRRGAACWAAISANCPAAAWRATSKPSSRPLPPRNQEFRMRLPRNLITLGLGLTLLNAGLATAAEELPAPIRMVQEKGARILGSFDAPDGLRGYAAEYQNQGMALYLTPDGKHVLTGHLFDAQGKDLSREPLERLVYAPLARKCGRRWSRAPGSPMAVPTRRAWSTCSATRTARTAPCSGSRRDPGWMPARCGCGISWSASSARTAKSAALLASKDPQKALHDHEQAGKASTLKPLAKIPAAVRKQLAGNMELMESMGAAAPGDLLSQCRGAHAAATGRAAAGPVGGDPRSR